MIAIHAHLAIPMRGVHRALFGAIDGDLVEVDAHPVALGIAISKQAALQHLIRRKADARYNGGGIKGRLLHILEIILRVAVQFKRNS